ncbi:MAG TPA: hypothetical protein PKL65_04830 [Bacteroidales bacterium]|nr:hypothetical protein [Bacteroidales bacterium]HNR41535.1 hypothetical protein [Bacteroidales bacterium]
MKRFLITSIFAAIVAAGTAMMPQEYPKEYLGLPGDNLNLYAVMKLFQESETLEGFERSLNDENSRINNLDLNNDNYIDYIKVLDYVDGNVHTIVLQAVLGRNESQDVAVFTVERFRDGSVQIQLVGDEALYGRNYIVEPYYAETPNPGYTGTRVRNNTTVVRTTYVEVAAWPVIRFIYLPGYTVWRSSWYWGYYPVYWRPWRPYYWHYYYGYHYHWFPEYYRYYHRYDRLRWTGWDRYYYRDRRVYSTNVTININTGKYRDTYSRPDQRKAGEAMYAKAHPERAATMSATGSRRSAADASTSRQGSGTSVNQGRRSSGTVSTGRSTSPSQGQAGTSRRSSETVNQNRGTAPVQGQAGTSRRSTETVNQNRSSAPVQGQAGGTRRSGSPAMNSGTRSTPQAGQAATGNRRSPEAAARPAPESRSQASAPRAASSARRGSTGAPAAASAGSSQRASKGTAVRESRTSSQGRNPESSSSRRK